MRDVQNEPDPRKIPIDKVGIRGLNYPITVLDREHVEQQTVASINMYVDLPHQFKGTHMSRFLEIIHAHRGMITIKSIAGILEEMKRRLNTEKSHFEVFFPYFMEKSAPVSGAKSLLEYRASFEASLGEELDFVLGVQAIVNALCPCSREISERGAHNQRSIVTVKVRFTDFIWIEELIQLIESSGSSEIFSLLKREDEKQVTEHSYDHPAFAEDIARNITEKLMKDDRISWFSVSVENLESIHAHNAYAYIERRK